MKDFKLTERQRDDLISCGSSSPDWVEAAIRDGDYGTLFRETSGDAVRDATFAEAVESLNAGAFGVFADKYGMFVYAAW